MGKHFAAVTLPAGDDMTSAQVERWVAQEFAKVNHDNWRARLVSENTMIDFAIKHGSVYPNSALAHAKLRDMIVAKFQTRVETAVCPS